MKKRAIYIKKKKGDKVRIIDCNGDEANWKIIREASTKRLFLIREKKIMYDSDLVLPFELTSESKVLSKSESPTISTPQQLTKEDASLLEKCQESQESQESQETEEEVRRSKRIRDQHTISRSDISSESKEANCSNP